MKNKYLVKIAMSPKRVVDAAREKGISISDLVARMKGKEQELLGRSSLNVSTDRKLYDVWNEEDAYRRKASRIGRNADMIDREDFKGAYAAALQGLPTHRAVWPEKIYGKNFVYHPKS